LSIASGLPAEADQQPGAESLVLYPFSFRDHLGLIPDRFGEG